MKIWVWLLVLTLFGQQLNAGLVAGRETMHLLDIKHMNSGSAASQRGQSRVVRDTHVTTHCGTDAQQALPPQVQQSLLTSALLSSTERDAVEPCVWLNMSQCYAPNVRALYAEGLPSRAYVRVVFHVPRYSNGTRALVSEQDLLVEAAKLNSYFSDQLNVEFDFLLHYVDNDYLRTAIIDTSTFQSIQDGKCDPSQDFPPSSFDGGDCDQLSQHRYQELGCARTSVGNRVCDPECNYAYFQWDGGDCCLGKLGDGLCRDPSSPKSVFQLAGNWKAQMMGGLQPYANNSAHIFVVPQFAVAQLLGIATFPWSPEALSPVGGLLVVSHYRNIKLVGDATDITIAHELGHCMGLFHTFSGVSEWACSDPCAETVSSPDRRIVGDMCSDTPPLPTWGQCSVAPQPSQDCNGDDFVGYPDQNVMSYTNCADRLTAQQYQIASCFLDSELLTWQGTWQQLLPHDVLPSGPAPSSWTCATSHYGTHDGCHCNCGAYDPDCELTRANEVEPLLYGCDHLANAQCNDQGVCVSTAVAPVSWTCPPEWFGSGDGCDCECGAVDLDCTTAPWPVSGCLEGTAGLNAFCSSTAQCAYTSEATAPTWVCPIEFYDANDGCDCNCGARDPDCDKGDSQSTKLYNCIEGYTPASSGDCYSPDVPSEWTCNPSYYAALDGCDCLCGVTDPDCEQAGAEFLMWNCPLSTSCKQGQCAAGEPVQQLVLQTDRNQVGCSLAANVSFLCAQYSQQNYNLFACDVEKFASYEFQVIGNKEYGYTFFLPELQLPVGFCSVNMQKSGSRISQVSLSCPILDITTFEQETCQFTFAAHSAASLLQASLLFSFFSLLLFSFFI